MMAYAARVLAFLVIYGISAMPRTVQASDRVVGFERAISIPAKKPFWKYLENFDNLCMGILITKTDVLGSCECMSEIKGTDQRTGSDQTEVQHGIRVISASILRVRTNMLINDQSEYINVTELKIHPKCDGWGGYDYAMARLKTPVRNTISLTENYFPFSSAAKDGLTKEDGEPECYISTYLKTKRDWKEINEPLPYSNINMIPVEVADTEECREFMTFDPLYVRYDWENKICIEAKKLLPICRGDIGVPLICNETLVGIVTLNTVFCDWNSSLNMVSSFNGAWEFIDAFIKTNGFQYWKSKAQSVLGSITGLVNN